MIDHVFLEDLKGMNEETIKEHLIEEYTACPESLKGLKILIAYESVGSWGCDSSSYFLFKKDNKYFEVFGSHCSCYGFENQFDLEETTVDALKIMAKKGFYHTGGYDSNERYNKKSIKDFIENL